MSPQWAPLDGLAGGQNETEQCGSTVNLDRRVSAYPHTGSNSRGLHPSSHPNFSSHFSLRFIEAVTLVGSRAVFPVITLRFIEVVTLVGSRAVLLGSLSGADFEAETSLCFASPHFLPD